MSSLFKYPKIKHIRQQSPPPSKNYHTFKPFLQKEFKRKCIYCMLSDTLPRTDSFGVEHYKPKKQFPEFSTVYSNLFYACNCCNRRKSNFWPNADQFKKGHFIPNPCENVMFDHLKYDEHFVKEKSHTGGFTIELLDFNDEKSLEYRSLIFDLINNINENRRRIKQTISELDKQIEFSEDENGKIELLKKKETHLIEENKLNILFEKLSGESSYDL